MKQILNILSKLFIRIPFCITDKLYLQILFFLKTGSRLHLNQPKTFQEKLQWLKLYNRKAIYTTMVDKFAVKEYVGAIIGQEYIIPTLGIWNSVQDINIDSLPDRFVLKTTHGGGNLGVVVCNDKTKFDFQKTYSRLNKSLSHNIYKIYREWPYKNVVPRIIAEPNINPSQTADLIDYKFFCFNGIVKYCQVIKGRNSNETIDFYDIDWEYQNFYGLTPNIKQSSEKNACPPNYKQMVNIAQTLSLGIPFVRVDMYNIEGKVYFGELTFFPASGFGTFTPAEWNNKIGDLIELPL